MQHSEIISKQDLANYLRCDLAFLDNYLNGSYYIIQYPLNQSDFTNIPNKPEVLIKKISIPKRNKSLGYRIVYSVGTDNLANCLKILNNHLSSSFKPIANVHGFVGGKNIKTNACEHLSKKNILSIDIKDFFETIDVKMICNNLIDIGFQKNIAEIISKLTTLNGRLVQGFSTSPTIANIVAHQLDKKLVEFCGQSIKYTRYADDLYFSSDEELPEYVEFENIVNAFGFELNHRKTKMMRRGQNQYVTGLSVFDSKTPRIPKRIKRNLRLEIYYIDKYGYESHILKKLKYSKKEYNKDIEIKREVLDEIENVKHEIMGWIHFINSIEPTLGKKLYRKHVGHSKFKFN